MRFTEFGPIIPNELLDERDSGGVVFLCGAGVSIHAGLTDFYRLTTQVAERLGVSPDSEPGQLLAAEKKRRLTGTGDSMSFDRIFTQLIRTYGRLQIESEVAAILSDIKRPSLKRTAEADMFVFQFGSDRENGRADLIVRYPHDSLFVLDKIIAEGTARPPYGLGQVLSRLVEAASEIRVDSRWQRLHRLVL